MIEFLRNYDVSYRIRRLRFVARSVREIDERSESPREVVDEMREAVHALIGRYRAAIKGAVSPDLVFTESGAALNQLASSLRLKQLDDEADRRPSAALAALPKLERRALILTYLGFPFYDVATLPLLQGEGLDEFDPVKVDRISPEDCTAIRAGGAATTLKGIQFNSFGAFFSRAYRENDYLWGRLHGAERLIDITLSALPDRMQLQADAVAEVKRRAFREILAEERERLTAISPLLGALEEEIG